MTEQFVPYELAVKLKQIGFDEPIFAYFSGERLKIIECFETLKNSDLTSWIYGAPLWQQAYQYLFEKSGKYIIPIPCDDENIGRWYAFGKPYKTYEEARLACLQELIKIVENDK